MEVKDFIQKTLVDISDGLEAAELTVEQPGRFRLVNTSLWGKGQGNYGLIEFDLAVTVEHSSSKKAKGGLKIYVVEASASGDDAKSMSSISRIKFVVEDRKT